MEEKQSQINTIIGMGLIFLLLYLWMQYSVPPKPTEEQANTQTSQTAEQPQNQQAAAANPAQSTGPAAAPGDSMRSAALAGQFGAFAPAASGQEQFEVLENDLVRITFSSKGGRIKEVFLKNFEKISSDTAGNEFKNPVRLLEDDKNRFGYELALGSGQKVNTGDLYFSAAKNGNTLTFRADAGEGRFLEQTYTLSPDNYRIEYTVGGNGMNNVLAQNVLRFQWANYLDKLEKNQQYERTMSTVYFKAVEESADYCDCRSNDTESLGERPVKWFSHSNQFFNTSFVANNFSFREFVGETNMYTDAEPDLKLLKTSAVVPLDNGTASMTIYTGPNEFDRLQAFGANLEDIIPFGSSIFGSINRWVIHPMFEFLAKFISNQGIVILMLTLLVKLLLYPLTYRMVLSQAKMAALKPRMEALKKKHGDDQQAMSVETMKMYSEYRVNPLGGCLPILLQMPIWFALYRFFPAAIEFRQESFLWATDLSSYDSIVNLPFHLPFGAGAHISLFTLIWVVTTLWYTWYSMKQMDVSAMQTDQMKIMKYMQYFMPVMFMFFFNSFASGLTLYLCFSNILNIGQTVVTKQFLIDNEKIQAELEANKNKPQKTGGWRDRFEQAMKEQQRLQAEKAKQQGKKK
ncbi:MAG: membrane protein insertase YidC [Haliscomenobacteraceae bacterium CHB4]|nr:Membrane protein insertase YidC [Saprospiraceae bacterium]MCE7925201.1 membrane protein insertase YidC [Haliscomenobacteraceae bacterium CHB4]